MSAVQPETMTELLHSIELTQYDTPTVVRTIFSKFALEGHGASIRNLWRIALDATAFGFPPERRRPNSLVQLNNSQTDHYFATSNEHFPALTSAVDSITRRTR